MAQINFNMKLEYINTYSNDLKNIVIFSILEPTGQSIKKILANAFP